MASQSNSVAVAVKAVLDGLALSPAPEAVLVRKRPWVLDGDALPLLIVSVADGERMEPVGADGAGTLWYVVTYPVGVAAAFRAGGLAGNNTDLRTWLDAVWPALTRQALRAAGLTAVNEVHPDGRPFFDVPAAGAQVDWGARFFEVEVLESR